MHFFLAFCKLPEHSASRHIEQIRQIRNNGTIMTAARFLKALRKTPEPAFKTIRFFIVLMIPVSFGVMLLDKSGILLWIAYFTSPLMGFMGLQGEAALVLLSSIFLNVYSAIAVIESLNFSVREIIILATLSTIAHNFPVECMILKKAGSSLTLVVLVRFFSAIAAAWVLNLILPSAPAMEGAAILLPGAIGIDPGELPAAIRSWLVNSFFFILKVSLIILAVIFIQKLLEEFGIIQVMGKAMSPLMRILGLSANTGYIWIVTNVIGLAFGSAALLEEIRSGSLSPSEASRINYHAAISHSQIEDNLLFVALGVPFLWAALPRFFMAIIVVWLGNAAMWLYNRRA